MLAPSGLNCCFKLWFFSNDHPSSSQPSPITEITSAYEAWDGCNHVANDEAGLLQLLGFGSEMCLYKCITNAPCIWERQHSLYRRPRGSWCSWWRPCHPQQVRVRRHLVESTWRKCKAQFLEKRMAPGFKKWSPYQQRFSSTQHWKTQKKKRETPALYKGSQEQQQCPKSKDN